ncbi:hypothetical protein ASC90_24950 [Rhizobium sp. Root1220]|nr:hypothetical protein ASC90_24950 [Rhizobium sp. Root1220]
MALDQRGVDELHRYMLALAKRAKPSNTTISMDDFIGAFIVIVFVASPAIPAVIPFLLIDDNILHCAQATFCLWHCSLQRATRGHDLQVLLQWRSAWP